MFDVSPQLDCAGRALILDRPRVMGIVNVTPDSFSDGGEHDSVDAAVAHALRLAEEGAETVCKGHTSFCICLGLIDTGNFIFDWIFDGRNIDIRFIEHGEDGKERGRLTTTCRSGDEDHAVWLSNCFTDNIKRVSPIAELLKCHCLV